MLQITSALARKLQHERLFILARMLYSSMAKYGLNPYIIAEFEEPDCPAYIMPQKF